MKVLAGLLAFMFCALMGYMKAYRLSAKSEAVCRLLRDLRQLGMQMEFTSMPISDLIARIKSDMPEVWDCMNQNLKEGASVSDSWQATLKKNSEHPAIAEMTDDVKILLNDFFSVFGLSDIVSQRNALNVLYSKMDSCLEQLERESRGKIRTLRGVGVLCGAALFIVMM